MIRLIHQTWKCKDLPACVLPSVESWKSLHPAWDHLLWTDEDNRRLIQECYPWFLSTYDAYPYDIQRADAIRYFILHRYGGIYADLDYQPFGPFDFLSATRGATFVKRWDGKPSNFLMYSGERRAVWESIIHRLELMHKEADYRRCKFSETVLHTTGPSFLGRVLDSYKPREEISFFNWAEFDPYDRFRYRLRSEEVHSLLRVLKCGSLTGRVPYQAFRVPADLRRLLAACRGIHWRVATWLQVGPESCGNEFRQ